VTRWQTVGLLTQGQGFPKGTKGIADLGGGVNLAPISTLLSEPGFTEWLRASHGHEELDLSDYAFVYEYEASGLGDPDPDDPKRMKQDAALERIQLASIALWLSNVIRPSFSAYAHAPLEMEGGVALWYTRRAEPIRPNQFDRHHELDEEAEQTIREISGSLYALPRPSPLWSAVRFLLFGLREVVGDTRITLLWIAIEALFGTIEPGPETSRELYRRIAGFFETTRKEQLAVHELAKAGWWMRCQAVHGGRTRDVKPEMLLERIVEAERILRMSFNRILRDPVLLATFGDDATREAFVATKSAEFQAQDGMSTRDHGETQ
jgi:hypothetical protein